MVKKLCILFHIGNIEIFEDILKYIRNIDFDYDIYINLNIELVDSFSFIQKCLPNSKIFINKNYGHDIFCFLFFIELIDVNEYSSFLFLHTKSDEKWRNMMIKPIFKNFELYIDYMIKNNVGVICASEFKYKLDHRNDDKLGLICDIMDIDFEKYNDIVEFKSKDEEINYNLEEIIELNSDIELAVKFSGFYNEDFKDEPYFTYQSFQKDNYSLFLERVKKSFDCDDRRFRVFSKDMIKKHKTIEPYFTAGTISLLNNKVIKFIKSYSTVLKSLVNSTDKYNDNSKKSTYHHCFERLSGILSSELGMKFLGHKEIKDDLKIGMKYFSPIEVVKTGKKYCIFSSHVANINEISFIKNYILEIKKYGYEVIYVYSFESYLKCKYYEMLNIKDNLTEIAYEIIKEIGSICRIINVENKGVDFFKSIVGFSLIKDENPDKVLVVNDSVILISSLEKYFNFIENNSYDSYGMIDEFDLNTGSICFKKSRRFIQSFFTVVNNNCFQYIFEYYSRNISKYHDKSRDLLIKKFEIDICKWLFKNSNYYIFFRKSDLIKDGLIKYNSEYVYKNPDVLIKLGFPFLKRKSVFQEIKIPRSLKKYGEKYTDLSHMTEIQLFLHYINHGFKENRDVCFDFILPINFTVQNYSKFNPDLEKAGLISDESLIEHFLKHGIAEQRKYSNVLKLNDYEKYIVKYILNDDIDNIVELNNPLITEYLKKCQNKICGINTN